MKTKVAIKSGNITPFGGIFYVMDEFSRLGMLSLYKKEKVMYHNCTFNKKCYLCIELINFRYYVSY